MSISGTSRDGRDASTSWPEEVGREEVEDEVDEEECHVEWRIEEGVEMEKGDEKATFSLWRLYGGRED